MTHVWTLAINLAVDTLNHKCQTYVLFLKHQEFNLEVFLLQFHDKPLQP